MKRELSGLYAIADSSYLDPAVFVNAVQQALIGGARILQFRDKPAADEFSPRSARSPLDPAIRARLVRDLGVLCGTFSVPLIVNDDIALAASTGAHGVHLGRDDADIREARHLLGPRSIIGVSCYNELDRARAAVAAGADYVAFGSFFPSRTKPGATQAGVDLLQTASRDIGVPIVAIGGITPENGGALIAAGAQALAAISGVFGQTDIRAAAARYASLFER